MRRKGCREKHFKPKVPLLSSLPQTAQRGLGRSSANGRSRVDGGRLLQYGQYHLPGTDEDRRIKLLETSSTANIMTTTARTATEAAASVGLT